MRRAPSSASSAPAIVRIAGMPAEVMAPFSSPACIEAVLALARLEEELARVRTRLVERLHAVIPAAAPEARRVLLTAKRDCFNGRGLSPRRRSRDWPLVEEAAPVEARSLGELEERLAAGLREFERAFDDERERERRHLLGLLGDDNLSRGLALASPPLLEGARRLDKPVASYGRKERGAEQSLLRYVSRTSLKLSPFSTLTRLGLGVVADRGDAALVELAGSGWTERRLLRVKKQILDQACTLLVHHPVFRSRLRIAANATAEKAAGRRYRFLRPAHWFIDRNAEALNYRKDALVAADLGGPLVEELEPLLAENLYLGDLVEILARRLDRDRSEIESRIDMLMSLGFLQLLPPWPTHETDQDRKLLHFLRTLPPDAALSELAGVLERILELSDARLPASALPGAFDAIDDAVSRALEGLYRALDLPAAASHPARRRLNEDVFLVADGGDWREVAAVSRRSAERAIASALPLLRYRTLRSNRHNFLHTLEAFAAERWPGRREVGFLDVFEALRPLWRDYAQSMKASRREKRWVSWNPLGLVSIDELQRLRKTVHDELQSRIRREGDDQVLELGDAEEVMRRIPDRYAPAIGPCLFIQPAERGRDLWVVNRLLDGTGRYSSRYTAVMDERIRERYTSHLTPRGVVQLDGGPVELVDILCARADHLNSHAVQTPRVLELPGELSDLPPERRLGLQDLRVRLDRSPPVLVDSAGRRVLPVFLGTVSLMVMPMVVRFLSQFGIGEYSLAYPSLPPVPRGESQFHGRLRIGSLVVRRGRWTVDPALILGRCAGASDAELFRVVNRWRLAAGIPDRVFVAERLPVEYFGIEVHKPQYLDFTSPSFIQVLRAAFESREGWITIEEMLPTPGAFPGRGRESWAVEVQLESIVFNDTSEQFVEEVHEPQSAGDRLRMVRS